MTQAGPRPVKKAGKARFKNPWRIDLDKEYERKAAKVSWWIWAFIALFSLIAPWIEYLFIGGNLAVRNLVVGPGLSALLLIARPVLVRWMSRHTFVQMVPDEELIRLARRFKENRAKKLMAMTDREAIGDLMHQWHHNGLKAPHYFVPSEAKRLYGPRHLESGGSGE